MVEQGNQNLSEPLLASSPEVEQQSRDKADETTETGMASSESSGSSDNENENGAVDNNNNVGGNEEFSIQQELIEMANLGVPLAVSFFCRMGMASTDSAFVGHIHDGQHSPETYLAAAVLSDMVVSLCITPPLAFNQVLNALVGQAVGSNNRPMAGIWLQQSMFWLSISMLPCLIGLFHVQPILQLMGFPADIAAVAGTYAKYNIVWPIPNGLYQCLRFYFQACGLPRPAMYNNLIFLGVNAILNWIFVLGGPFRYLHVIGLPSWHGLGFIGAAISLSISRTMQGVCYFLYMFVYKQHHQSAWPEAGWSFSHHTRDRTIEFLKQSLPNLGTLIFSAITGQATTVLVGRLGELSIAASSALSTVTIPWSGTLSATSSMVTGVRVGYHLGRGQGSAAKRAAQLVNQFISVACLAVSVLFLPLRSTILKFATDDQDVLEMASTLILAMLVGTYLNLIVSNITSGVFSGQGRPLIATLLSFGFELPTSIGGVAIYILLMHGNLLGVYWWGAISGAIEAALVVYLMMASNWDQCAQEAIQRQEAASSNSSDNNDDNDNTTPLLEHGSPDDNDDGSRQQQEQEEPVIARV